MYTETIQKPEGKKLNMWLDFLKKSDLDVTDTAQTTVLVWEDGRIVATGSRDGSVLKYISVDKALRGENLTATVVSHLRKDAAQNGLSHLFVYTKPQNEAVFSSLFFYRVIATGDVVLMESKRGGIDAYLSSLPPAEKGENGAIVANCNPFTLGHRYLMETAARECDRLYVFVLSEDKSLFGSEQRLQMTKLGTRDIGNVTVLPTGPYLISEATFPSYFLKKDANEVRCDLDVEIFARLVAPRLGITKRFVGTEPICPVTAQYNKILGQKLPQYGIDVHEIPRLEYGGKPICARNVREYIDKNEKERLKGLVPQTTLDFLKGR